MKNFCYLQVEIGERKNQKRVKSLSMNFTQDNQPQPDFNHHLFRQQQFFIQIQELFDSYKIFFVCSMQFK